jgi:hypothetical protein
MDQPTKSELRPEETSPAASTAADRETLSLRSFVRAAALAEPTSSPPVLPWLKTASKPSPADCAFISISCQADRRTFHLVVNFTENG